MSNYEVISKEGISNPEVLNFVEKREKEKELTYREERTKEYLKKVTKLKITDFKKAKEEILSLEIPRIEEEHIIKVLDIMPKSGPELRAIVSHSGTILVDEDSAKILDILKKYQ
jgi:DNA-directed RNA polymerase subunit F